MKNFIIFAVLAALLGGCAVTRPAKSDKEFKFYDGNKTVIYKFAGEDLYENGRNLGAYSIYRNNIRTIAVDGAGRSYGNNYRSALNAKRMKFYHFDDEGAMIFSVWHKDGICSVYNAGQYVNFDFISNTFKDGDWLYADGKISKSDDEGIIQNGASKKLGVYKTLDISKLIQDKKMDRAVKISVTGVYLHGYVKAMKTRKLDDFCK